MTYELFYDHYYKYFVSVCKPVGQLSHVLAKIRREQCGPRLRALQDYLESINGHVHPKMRYTKVYFESDIAWRYEN